MEGTLEGAQGTADIVQGLRRFSAMDREERSAVDLNAVVERAIHWVCKGTAPTFSVHWQPSEQPCWVQGSAGQLLQVLMNLIQNAYDAAAEFARQPALWISLQIAPQDVTLTLRDNGPSIAPENLGLVFDPFFTAKPVGPGYRAGLVDQLRHRRAARRAPERGQCAGWRRAVHAGAAACAARGLKRAACKAHRRQARRTSAPELRPCMRMLRPAVVPLSRARIRDGA
jgi:hypothetical protein